MLNTKIYQSYFKRIPMGWITAALLTAGAITLLLGFWQIAVGLICLSGLYIFFTADIFKLTIFMLIFTAFNAITVVTIYNYMPISGMKIIQTWREVLEIILIARLILKSPARLWQMRLTAVDYAVIFFLLMNLVYTLLPIGLDNMGDRIVALRQNCGHFLAFFVGRLLILTIEQKKLIGLWLAALGILTALVGILERFFVPEAFLTKVLNYPRYFNDFTGFYPGRKEGALPPFYYYEATFRRASSFLLSSLELYTFMILAAVLLVAWWLIAEPKERKTLQIPAAIGLLIILTAFVLAFTRAAFPLMLLVFIILGVLASRGRARQIIFALIGLSVAIGIGLILFNTTIRTIFIRTITLDESSGSEHLRRILQGLDAFKDAPFGYGVGIGGITGLRIGGGLGGENSYVAKLVDFGIIGAISYLAVLVSFVWAGWAVFRRATATIDRIFGLVILAFTVQFALHSLVSEDFLFKVSTHYMFFIAGVVAACWSQLKPKSKLVVGGSSTPDTPKLNTNELSCNT